MSPVASSVMSRRQPSTGTTCNVAPMPNRALYMRASSPTVMPCRSGIGYIPTNDANAGSSTGPSTIVPPIGFGRSSTANGNPLRGGGLHRQRHRRHARVRPRADVLHVVHEHVDVAEHLGRRLPHVAVEGVHGQAGLLVRPRGNGLAGGCVTAQPVLEREQRRQSKARVGGEQVDVVAAARIDARDVRDQADALAARPLRRVGDELVEPRTNGSGCHDAARRWRRRRRSATYSRGRASTARRIRCTANCPVRTGQ